MKFLLKLFSKKTIWSYLLEREGFSPADTIESTNVWQDVFGRIPHIKEWLKRREIMILRSIALDGKDPDFVKGQLAENRLYASFDVPGTTVQKVETKEIEAPKLKLPEFLSRWKNKSPTDAKSERPSKT